MQRLYAATAFILISFLIGLSGNQAIAQNLVPNWSFEYYDVCPFGFGTGGPLYCPPWVCGSDGTADYFNECSEGIADVPYNWEGFQPARTGVAYTGMLCRLNTSEYREYIQVALEEPLVAGLTYHVSFYVNPGDETCFTYNMGLYFSSTPPPPNGIGPLNVIPQIESTLGYITDTLNWALILGCYEAVGGEQYITIGNFYPIAETPPHSSCQPGNFISYYYIDDVTVIEVPAGGIDNLELGPPLMECDSVHIESNITNVAYSWSTGETTPNITVYTTGIYYLTVTGGCDEEDIQVDSVMVTVLGTYPPVDIPEDEATICTGDTFLISLEPLAGDYEWQDGSNDATYIITTPGTYQVTLDNGCETSEDEMEIFVNDPPETFSLGPDLIICPGDEVLLSFDSSLGDFHWQDNSDESSYLITSGGEYALTISNQCGQSIDLLSVTLVEPPILEIDEEPYVLCENSSVTISLDPSEGNYVWEDGSTDIQYEITSPGFYGVTVTNVCGTEDANILVEYFGEPLFSLGEDIDVCSGQFPFLLNAGIIEYGVDYFWNTGDETSAITINDEGIYTLTVSNPCFQATDQIEIIIDDIPPVVTLPQDQPLCDGDSLELSVTGIVGDVLWQDGSSSSTYIVDTAGTYFVTVSNLCGTGSDTVLITSLPTLLSPDLGPDLSLCPGQPVVLHTQVSGAQYQWSDGSIADSLLVTIPGTYYVQVSDQCGVASDTIVVGLNNNPPQVALPDQLSLCQGQSITLDAGISGVSFLWNDNSQNQQLLVSAPGTYSLTVSNACGTDIDTVIILDGGPAPSVDLGNDIQICPGDQVVLSPSFSNVDTWLWQDGSTMPSFDVSTAGLINVAVSNACGVSYDTLLVELLPATPPLDLGPDTSLCSFQSFTLSIQTPGVAVLWPDGSTDLDYIVSGPGEVTASISNTCGTSYDTLIVNALPGIPTLDLGNDQSLCPGEVINISPGIANVNYLWHDGSTQNTFQSTQEETIILTITNNCGSSTDTLEIFESTQGPQVNLGPDILECEGTEISIPSGISGVNYLWQDGSMTSDFTTNTSGTFILQVSNNCGSDTDTIIVDISGVPPSPSLGPDTILCEGNTLLLISNADAITSIQWQDGSSSPSFIVSSPGTFILDESNRCGDATDSITVTFLDKPDPFTLGPDTTLCPGESIVLTAPSTSHDILWQDGSNQSSIVADQPITYSLRLSNECGVVSDELVLSFDTRVPVIDLGPDLPWCEGDVFTLDATQPFIADYFWSTGASTPSINISTPGVYSVEVNTRCSLIAQEIGILPGTDCETPESNTDLYIPNVFSPNGDGINDVFSLSYSADLDIVSMEGSVFDRWGNLVFSSNVIPFTWDGYFDDEAVMPGVYVYSIKVQFLNQGLRREEVFVGDVTLVR